MSDITHEQASKVLGRHVDYKDTYNPEVLVSIDRSYDRRSFDFNTKNVKGFDVWHAYECSFLLPTGLPAVGVGKFIIPMDTPNIVESKSLKLYLFSLNMEKIESISQYEQIVSKDVSKIVGKEIEFKLHTEEPKRRPNIFKDYIDITDSATGYVFNTFEEDPSLVKTSSTRNTIARVRIPQLRSNCRVTKQPDWGELFIDLTPTRGNYTTPDWASVLQYVVSFRNEAHFHEEVVERLFSTIINRFPNTRLCVTATYTRRGGIDICPIRTNFRIPRSLRPLTKSTELVKLPMRS